MNDTENITEALEDALKENPAPIDNMEVISQVRFVGTRMPSVSHGGALGDAYFFSKDNWVTISASDISNYKRKAVNNPQNWEYREIETPKFQDVAKVTFKGTKENPETIELTVGTGKYSGEDENKIEETIKIKFAKGKWVTIPSEHESVVELFRLKSLSNGEIWGFQIVKEKI